MADNSSFFVLMTLPDLLLIFQELEPSLVNRRVITIDFPNSFGLYASSPWFLSVIVTSATLRRRQLNGAQERDCGIPAPFLDKGLDSTPTSCRCTFTTEGDSYSREDRTLPAYIYPMNPVLKYQKKYHSLPLWPIQRLIRKRGTEKRLHSTYR